MKKKQAIFLITLIIVLALAFGGWMFWQSRQKNLASPVNKVDPGREKEISNETIVPLELVSLNEQINLILSSKMDKIISNYSYNSQLIWEEEDGREQTYLGKAKIKEFWNGFLSQGQFVSVDIREVTQSEQYKSQALVILGRKKDGSVTNIERIYEMETDSHGKILKEVWRVKK